MLSMVAKNDSYIYEYTIANLLIKTMSDIVVNNSNIIAALNQAICDFNERLMEHKEYFCNEIKKIGARTIQLRTKTNTIGV